MTDADRLRFEEWGRRLAHKAFGAQWAVKKPDIVPPPKPALEFIGAGPLAMWLPAGEPA